MLLEIGHISSQLHSRHLSSIIPIKLKKEATIQIQFFCILLGHNRKKKIDAAYIFVSPFEAKNTRGFYRQITLYTTAKCISDCMRLYILTGQYILGCISDTYVSLCIVVDATLEIYRIFSLCQCSPSCNCAYWKLTALESPANQC